MAKKLVKKRLTRAEIVKAENRRFRRLSPAKKRVAIAEDVLKQLAEGRYVATPGCYFEADVEVSAKDANKQICDIIRETSECNVCALGSAFASAVKFANALKVEDVQDVTWMGDYPNDTENLDPFDREYLGKFFAAEQMDLMESAFERRDMRETDVDTGRAVEWGFLIGDPTERLETIMKNIIRNDGEFIPEIVEVAR